MAAFLLSTTLLGCSSDSEGKVDTADRATTTEAERVTTTEASDDASDDEDSGSAVSKADRSAAADLLDLGEMYMDGRDAFGDAVLEAGADESLYPALLATFRDDLYGFDGEVRELAFDDADLVATVNAFLDANRAAIVEFDAINAEPTAESVSQIAPLVAELDVAASDLLYAAAIAAGELEDDRPSPGATLLTVDDPATTSVRVSPSRRGICEQPPVDVDPVVEAGGVFQTAEAIYTQRVLAFADESDAERYVEETAAQADECDPAVTLSAVEEFDGGIVVATSEPDGTLPASLVLQLDGTRVVVGYVFADAVPEDGAQYAGAQASKLATELIKSQAG